MPFTKILALALLFPTAALGAQTQPPPPTGTIIFSRETPTDPDTATPPAPTPTPNPAPSTTDDPLHITDAERDALTFTAYDLDLHLTSVTAALSARAALTLRNDSPAPLPRLVLQISSSLHWEAVSTLTPSGSARLDLQSRRIASDADHTGSSSEAVVTLPQPLAPGASIAITALYSGAIPLSAERLERIGAPAAEADAADWDAIQPSGTALRGFGNVLWYPVAAPPAFLGDGARLFQAIGRAKLRQSAATIRLRLAVEYTGDPPDAAYFCGRREPLTPISDNADAPADAPADAADSEATGIATALFAPQPLGFRTPSLFVTQHPPTQVGASSLSLSSSSSSLSSSSSSSSSASGPTPAPIPELDANLIAAITDRDAALPSYAAAAALVTPLLTDWFGPQPLTPLTLLDHPGQPFEDGALLVRPMQVENAANLAPSLAHSLTHAWIRSSHAWIDEGLAQFAGLLWTERTLGRPAALAELQDSARALALVEPPPSDTPSASTPSASTPEPAAPGQSLLEATSDTYFRTKAAAVWWMLRDLTGDEALKQALQAYRAASDTEPALDPKLDQDPQGLELTLEKFAHKDLRWFFNDWVYRDRGLPDLTIVNVTPRQQFAANGEPSGWLIAIEVRNDGDATADVPWTVSSRPVSSGPVGSGPAGSGTAATATQRLRIPGHTTLSRRIVFASTPAEVQVNDGSVPETRTSIHTRQLVLPTR